MDNISRRILNQHPFYKVEFHNQNWNILIMIIMFLTNTKTNDFISVQPCLKRKT